MAEPLVSWTAHPARGRPRDVALVIAVVATTAAAVLAAFESALFAALATVVLLVAVAPFLLPTRYEVTGEGVSATRAFTRRERRFAELRRVEVGERAALVSPFARPSVLDRHRGLLLLLDGLGGAERERLLALLRERIRP